MPTANEKQGLFSSEGRNSKKTTFFVPEGVISSPLGSFFLLFSSSGRKKPKEETPQRGLFPGGKQKEVLPKAILWKKKKKRRETNKKTTFFVPEGVFSSPLGSFFLPLEETPQRGRQKEKEEK